jgi:hypothetical protein
MDRLVGLLSLGCVAGCAAPRRPADDACGHVPPPVVEASPPRDAFYAKVMRSDELPIRASLEAPDVALIAARERLSRMLEAAPSVRHNLEEARFEVRVTARGQLVSDLPEFRFRRGTRHGAQDFDEHTRAGGHQELRFVVCATETLLGGKGDRQPNHDLCVHELAHGLYWVGLSPGVRARVLARWRTALAAGLWRSAYAARNEAEFFAELSMWYFGSEGGPSPEVPKGRGPLWLLGYDPESFALLDSIYRGRLDPGHAPRAPLARVEGARELRSVSSDVPVVVEFVNRTGLTLQLAWIDFEGRRQPTFEIPPGVAREAYTFATHVFSATDPEGRELGAFVAPPLDGIVELHLAQ